MIMVIEDGGCDGSLAVGRGANAEEVSDNGVNGGRLFGGPRDSRCIVATDGWGPPSQVSQEGRKDSLVEDQCCEFQV